MKLRNKKTGEIYSACHIAFGESIDDLERTQWKTLKEFNEDWEDYEEPKKHHYYVEPRGQVIELVFGDDIDELKEELREIGNYFETKEEAEKAVDKLKAWKRLKDKGFKFEAYKPYGTGITFTIAHMDELTEDNKKDLDLLFGGEE